MPNNIGEYFFRLLNKHFSSELKFRKIFNRKTLKLNYSCMPNLNGLITTIIKASHSETKLK